MSHEEREKLNEVIQYVQTLAARILKLEKQMKTLADLGKGIMDLQAAAKAATDKIAALQGTVNSHAAEIASLQTQLSAFQNDATTIDGDATAVEAVVANLNAAATSTP